MYVNAFMDGKEEIESLQDVLQDVSPARQSVIKMETYCKSKPYDYTEACSSCYEQGCG